MNKKFVISWVAVFVVWMIAGMLVHGIWLGETYAAMTDMMRPEAEQQSLMHFMMIAHVLMAGAFVGHRRGTIHVFFLFHALGRELEGPGKEQRQREADQQKEKDEFADRLGQSQHRDQDIGQLQD